MKNPEISIIMPIYNSEKFLKTAIESVLNQTFENFELILINDGSKDSSGEICNEYEKKDKRIVVHHQENSGICASRNKGLSLAKGKYIMFMDNDDTIEKNTLEDNYNIILKNNVDIVKFARKEITIVDEEIIKIDVQNLKDTIFNNNKEVNENLINLVYETVMVCIWDGIYKKDIISNFDTVYKFGGEDIDYNYKIIKNANGIAINSGVYYNHYLRKNFSTSSKYYDNMYEIIERLHRNFIRLTEQNYENNEKYNIILIRDYLNKVLRCYSYEDCKLKYTEKIENIKSLNLKFRKCNIFKMFKISKKHTIEYILHKLHFYGLLVVATKSKKY